MQEHYIEYIPWLCLLLWINVCASTLFTNDYAVEIHGGSEVADLVASNHGFINLGQIFENHFHFLDKRLRTRRSLRSNEHHVRKLTEDLQVKWIQQQQVLSRKKRDHGAGSGFNDPEWPNLWYLHRSDGLDMNVLQAWNRGYTGHGVIVTILDDGIEHKHHDLARNYDATASYDVNDEDPDPTPRYNPTNENRHGTRCAGEVAAVANNNICSVGVAYNAGIGGVRMLDGDVTDIVEARSLSHAPQHVDIYSSSWGPDDDGRTVDGPGPLARKAFKDGIKKGRNGLGSIFVWASGNGGRNFDSCNCDGYTNTVYTLSISSVSEDGLVPWYSERCASTLATTYSSGSGSEKQVITTDLNQACTEQHSGTSASAPLAAAVCALALEANPNLSWRDMQHITVMTSRADVLHTDDWATNGAGYKVSHAYGFGLMDAGAMVAMAEQWNTVPKQHICTEEALTKSRQIPSSGSLVITYNTSACWLTDNSVRFLEHVQARLSLSFTIRGDLVIFLTSPMGTKSKLLTKRPKDYSSAGFNNWDFMTTHSWGEDPRGVWTLEIKNVGNHVNTGTLQFWSLSLYGTRQHPLEKHTGPKECSGGYYLSVKASENGTLINTCTPCHHSCRSCFGTDSGDCIECSANYYVKSDTYCVLIIFSSHYLYSELAVVVLLLIVLFSAVYLCFYQVWLCDCCHAKYRPVNQEVEMQKSKLLDCEELEGAIDDDNIIYEDQRDNIELT